MRKIKIILFLIALAQAVYSQKSTTANDYVVIDKKALQTELETLNVKYNFSLTLDLWDSFINEMTPVNNGQITMFA